MAEQIPRYGRQTLLRFIGEDGQTKIGKARVFVAGVGALGCLISTLLARAGVGFLRIADRDEPELHNLHRQILYDETDLGKGMSKVRIAEQKLRAANSHVTIDAVEHAVGPDNVESLCRDVDLVVDALDNITTRYLINDVIIAKGIPYVFGGAVEAVGNVMTIIPGKTPCLRCLWPDPEAVVNHPTAAQVGVLSAAAAAIASIEVAETLKLIVGAPEDCIRGLLVMDLWRSAFQIAPVQPAAGCVCRAAPRTSV
ncbi:MAG: HesA/MoeB/ThiF family protein [Thermodesulfobacteriota bacterium]